MAPIRSILMPIQRLRLYDVLEILVKWSMRLSDSVLKGCWALYARIETKKTPCESSHEGRRQSRHTKAHYRSTEVSQDWSSSIA